MVWSDTTCLLLLLYLSDVEAVIYILSFRLPVMHATFLLCMLPSLCCHIAKLRRMGKYLQHVVLRRKG